MITNTFTVSIPGSHLSCRGMDPASCVFFDIETTGFKPETSHLYLIGAAVWDPQSTPGTWIIRQWMSGGPEEEARLLHTFFDFLNSSYTLVHFNGKRFDLPYLEEKCTQYQLSSPFAGMESLDLYQDFRTMKSFLNLERMNQRALETFLGLNREDPYDGGQLISVYRKFVRTGDSDLIPPLLLHNREDVSGMIRLTSLYSYWKLLQDGDNHPPFEGNPVCGQLLTRPVGTKEVLLSLTLDTPVPIPISHMGSLGYFSLSEGQAKWLLPVREEPLCYFFPDYKNYYYLPQEDQAIHKSVAVYVDKQYRQQAVAENCYIRKEGPFLPQPEELFTPSLRSSFRDKQQWFSLTEEFLQDQEKLARYLSALIRTLV